MVVIKPDYLKISRMLCNLVFSIPKINILYLRFGFVVVLNDVRNFGFVIS